MQNKENTITIRIKIAKGIKKHDFLRYFSFKNYQSELGRSLFQCPRNCKAGFLSSMMVYYSNHYMPTAKMISIDKYDLERARQNL